MAPRRALRDFLPAFDCDWEDVVSCTNFHVRPNGSFGSTTQHVLFNAGRDKPGTSQTVEEDLNISESSAPADIKQCEEATLNPQALDNREDPEIDPIEPKRSSYNPLSKWLGKRDEILREMIRLEGRGAFSCSSCPTCGSAEPLYRCTQCSGGEMFCKQCILQAHVRLPLHVVECWTDNTFFKRKSLKQLGMKVQLGHISGEKCRSPIRAHDKEFTVIDIYGIHGVDVYFCNCREFIPPYIQILRFGWYPASVDQPRTAATMNVLKFFQLLNFESKASQFEFYNTLSRWTDNTGLATQRDCYPAFGIMVREIRNLKQLKRAGRAHKSGGADGTSEGELAVLCPACPQPGINMDPQWQISEEHEKFLHTLFLAIDANFRLKRRNVSSEEKDPSLSGGCAYFVPQEEYDSYLAEFDKEIHQPKSTCSDHKAVNAERCGKGLAVTGVVAVDCARHDMKRPLAVADLRKGERFVNSDFVVLKSLQNSEHLLYVISYDICCQWSPKIWERMAKYPTSLHIDRSGKKSYRFLVPKFHLPSHIMPCQTRFSFNFAPHVGRTDGEAPERGWARINPIATSSAEMGPGNRRDTIDDHFCDSNWKKSIIMGVSLKKKIENAFKEATEYSILHNEFASALPQTAVQEWETELQRWNADNTSPNPFEKRYTSVTLESVRRRLALQDALQAREGNGYVLHELLSASQLVAMGLELEEQQRQLFSEVARFGSGQSLGAKLQNRANVLERRIRSWIQIQHLYMPSSYTIREQDSTDHPSNAPETAVCDIKLYLPSETICKNVAQCDERLIAIEHELRKAQANDALAQLRDALRLRSFVYKDKRLFQRGQIRNTRSRGILARIQCKIDLAALAYKSARRAIAVLSPKLGIEDHHWKAEFPHLSFKKDVRSLDDDDLPNHMKNRKRKRNASKPQSNLSWIWKRLGVCAGDEDEQLREELRIEFVKSKARSQRWKEEVLLLQEEMHRVRRFFQYQSRNWTALGRCADTSTNNLDAAVREGLRAYAMEQAHLFDSLANQCEQLWENVPEYSLDDRGEIISEPR